MNFLFTVNCFLILFITVVATEGSNSTTIRATNSKETEKLTYPKKVNSIKKNHLKSTVKKRIDITEKFADLPADDLAFIKELDKQFKLHGGKVKIKVENKNVTEAKNSKRTIDRELGYGYHYDPPKFMFYPYSQQNIGSNSRKYYLTGDTKAEISIEPSYSYELKSQSYVTQNQPQLNSPNPQHQQHTEQQQYEEPVIVLRIPGPAKYATHLQMLLQKYLEIRASQYLRILEEAEQRNIQNQHQVEQFDYDYGNNAVADIPVQYVEEHQQRVAVPQQHGYAQPVQYDHQNAVPSQPVQYPEIDNVYHSYKHRHFSHHKQAQIPLQDTQSYYATQQGVEEQQTPQNEHQQQEQHQYQEEQFQYQQQVQEQPQYYYTHQQQYSESEDTPANVYQQVFLVAMTHPGQVDHETSQGQQEKPQAMYEQDQTTHNQHSLSLPIAENNPRPTHTRVVFTHKNQHPTQDYQMYQLPSIKPNERHAPTSTPDYHQDFAHQQSSSSYHQQHYNAADTTSQEVVAITQRPHNYHAHSVKTRTRGRTAHSRRAATSNEKLGAATDSTAEF